MAKFLTKAWVLLGLFLVTSNVAFGALPFELGVEADWRQINLGNGAIPPEVKAEADDPSIVNPYSDRLFEKDVIGTYDPKEDFSGTDWAVYAQYTVPVEFRVQPYVRVSLGIPWFNSTHTGSFGEGYTYSKVLGSGVDFVRYTYGIKYEAQLFFEPEIGFNLVNRDRHTISCGVSYQRFQLTYYKGIEAHGRTTHLYELASAGYDVLTYKLRCTTSLGSWRISIEPSLIQGAGVTGYGVAVTAEGWF
jgi:hypothetical protein